MSFGTAAAATLPSDASVQISAKKVVAVPVTISAQGGYDALRNFVDQMQRIDRIAVPTSVSYSVADDDSQSTVTINSNILAILSSGSTQTNASSDAIENATSGVSKYALRKWCYESGAAGRLSRERPPDGVAVGSGLAWSVGPAG